MTIANVLPARGNAFHETKIFGSGDVVHSNTGELLGNLFDYMN